MAEAQRTLRVHHRASRLAVDSGHDRPAARSVACARGASAGSRANPRAPSRGWSVRGRTAHSHSARAGVRDRVATTIPLRGASALPVCRAEATPVSFYNNRRVAVIGGFGFIGLNLTGHLRRLGAHVTVVTRSLDAHRDAIAG